MTTGDDAAPDLDLLGVMGRVEPPGQGVLDAAREVLWSAVAQEMLSAAPADPRSRAAKDPTPRTTGEQQTGPRHREHPGS